MTPSADALAYDRAAVRGGVVHLGIGAFHRAHQAVVFDDALRAGDFRWGVTGVSLRSGAVRDLMAPQDGLYTLVVRDGAEVTTRVIGAVLRVLVAPEDPAAVVAALADADTHLVTLTVTEKGYKVDRATGGLLADAEVARDLASLVAPVTAPGFIVAGLKARRAAGLAPFTVISCDNLPDNGRLLRGAVLAMARAHDAELADWIAAHGAFPGTMVDRIVPATTNDDVAAVGDPAMVKTEPFTQWVIEDDFVGARPDFAAFGVQLTKDVAPWEAAKLRLLNGAHSGIAYLGGLAGLEFVHQVVAAPGGRGFVEALWDEAAATLVPPAGLDLAQYRGALMARFANPALQHRTRQIAMDGSQKLPQRLLAPIAERRAMGLPVAALTLAVAAWVRWQGGLTDAGERFVVDDPLAGVTAAAGTVAAMVGIGAIFPTALAGDPAWVDLLAGQVARLERDGAAAVLERFR